MTVLEIDTEATSSAARTWVAWGDAIDRNRQVLVDDVAALHLSGVGATPDRSLGAAAVGLWTSAVFAELVVERVEVADRFGAAPAIDAAAVSRLMRLAGSTTSSSVGVRLPWITGFSPSGGELGGTYGAELRSPWLFELAPGEQRGRELVLRALADTATSAQIRNDEFAVVRMSDGRYLVVLPGVTDLSSQDLGWSDRHRSVRDIDQAAYPSSRSASVDDNAYARMVAEALRSNGVPVGSELVLVGHSFGADTALDLAADGSFNGAAGYRVTHVVAAAYHSRPQLDRVPATTEVLVLQNRRDVPVIVEGVGAAHVTEAVEARVDLFDAVLDFDVPGILTSGARTVYHDVGAAVSAVDHTIGHAGDVADVVIGAATADLDRAIDGATDFVTLQPGVSRLNDHQVVAVFDGGFDGYGHAQDNYTAFVQGADDPLVTAFFASLGAAGPSRRSGVGSVLAIDVSVP
jgi:hypothetical protein